MKHFSLFLLLLAGCMVSCSDNNVSFIPPAFLVRDTIVVKDTVIVRDTISYQNGVYIYNLPSKVEYINFEQSGKAILMLWLHGGVRDQKAHNLLNPNDNHIDKYRDFAYNFISSYLHRKGIKAVYIAPICHKAEIPHCVSWINCETDIKWIIDDYVSKGIVDDNRIYVAGCSDGGTGVWDYVSKHGDWFAAGMSFSSGNYKFTKVPMYCSSTSTNNWGDMNSTVNNLRNQGVNIRYQFCPNTPHGWDEKIVVTDEYLDSFFSHTK